MTSPQLKAVIFDIGGVVVRSPLLAIADYEKERGIPPNYINCCITGYGNDGAWQRFERGEITLFPFYDAFGRELSDTTKANVWYTEYCRRRGIQCPALPDKLEIDGRELFGRMMRQSSTYDDVVVEAILRIRATGKWRVIALTNNFAKSGETIMGYGDAASAPPLDRYPNFSVESEREFLGWTEGATPPALVALFDDFCDSSTIGMRKPDPAFYLYACERNNVKPEECVFLDDLGMNLKPARQIGMETIHVPINASLPSIKQLEQKLGIDLTTGAPFLRSQLEGRGLRKGVGKGVGNKL